MGGDEFEDVIGSGALTVLTRMRLDPGAGPRFDALIGEYAACVRRYEPGCEHYSVVRAVGAERRDVLIIARYASLAAYHAHVGAPHTVSILSMLSALIDGPPELEIYVD